MRHAWSRALLGLAAVWVVGCSAPTGDSAAPVTLEAAAEAAAAEVREAVETDGRGGAALGIFVGGEAVLVEGFGVADLESGEAASPEHLFRIGSITKPVTAMAMLALIEEGRARRGDPVRRFVPELSRVENPFDWAPGPTIFQLATMTGGLAREPVSASRPENTRSGGGRDGAPPGGGKGRTEGRQRARSASPVGELASSR